jgi:uncharacterized protein
MEELPEVVPLFPLPNVVLFPHVDLPLHVFEPRYREMVRDAMEAERLIGMVLLRGDWRRDYLGSPAVFSTGCVGRIERFDVIPDGRSNLVLRGLRCFEISEEVPGRSYRRARVRWRDDRAPVASDAIERVRSRLRVTVTRLLERSEDAVSDDFWERLPSDLERLVNTLGFCLPLGVIEKLSVLECGDVGLRAERLVEILEFRLAEAGSWGPGKGPEDRWH